MFSAVDCFSNSLCSDPTASTTYSNGGSMLVSFLRPAKIYAGEKEKGSMLYYDFVSDFLMLGKFPESRFLFFVPMLDAHPVPDHHYTKTVQTGPSDGQWSQNKMSSQRIDRVFPECPCIITKHFLFPLHCFQ